MLALLCQAAGLVESVALPILPTMHGFLAVARGLAIPSLLVVIARGLVIPSLKLAVVARVFVIPMMRLLAVAPLPGIGMPSRWLVAPCTRVAHTRCFTARLVLESGEHPAVLKDQVTSPGGTTIAGLHVLEEKGLRDALISAVQAAARRSAAAARALLACSRACAALAAASAAPRARSAW